MEKTVMRPSPGLIVRDPVTGQPLRAKGAPVDLSLPYWRRRLKQGDISPPDDGASADKTAASKKGS